MQMVVEQIKIVEFEERYQQAVEDLVLPIQTIEFGVPTSREDQPDLMEIKNYFQKGKGNFWLAMRGDEVVGSIGLVDIGNDQIALKKMFVKAEYRGKQIGIAQNLLDGAIQWCRGHGIKSIMLGSTPPMLAAHRFYEKNGFHSVEQSELPSNFPIVAVDKKFFRMDL